MATKPSPKIEEAPTEPKEQPKVEPKAQVNDKKEPSAHQDKPAKDNKNAFYQKWWFWVIIASIFLIAAISSTGDKERPQENASTSDSETTSQTTEQQSGVAERTTGDTSSDGAYGIGQKLTAGHKEVTVLSVERNFSFGNEFLEPEAGKEFVKIDVQFVNTGTSSEHFYSSDWKITDNSGVTDGVSGMIIYLDNSLSLSLELAGGGKATRSLLFEVPSGDTGLWLDYSASLLKKFRVSLH